MQYKQQGFTLIELMIALALGLIVTAAAVMLFISGQRSLALQQATAEIQDNSNFALNYIVKNIRLANLNGGTDEELKFNTRDGGIVFSGANLSGVGFNDKSWGGNGPSNVAVKSDQLTIQYKPEIAGGYDCEGQRIENTNEFVIERYFIRKDGNVMANENKDQALSLACKAVRTSNLKDLKNNGQVIVKRADYFQVLLIVKSLNQNNEEIFKELTINDYTGEKQGQIVGVKLGILARSTQTIDRGIPRISIFQALTDKRVILKPSVTSHHVREMITQTVSVRNALKGRSN